jgi:hypothetical protein
MGGFYNCVRSKVLTRDTTSHDHEHVAMFTFVNVESQQAETAHVNEGRREAAQQFPFGDDVSIIFRCEAPHVLTQF